MKLANRRWLLCLVAVVLLFAPNGFAQHKADSLYTVIKTTSSDTIRAKTITLLFKELYFSGKTDSALHFALHSKDFIEGLVNKYSSSDAKTIHCLKIQRYCAYGNIGKMYLNMGNFPETMKYDTVALRLAIESEDKMSIATARGDIGSLYTCEGSYVDALKNELEGLKIDQEINNKRGMASAYTNIGNVYRAEHDYENALKNHRACLKVSREMGFKQGAVWAYNNMGDIYEEQGKNDKALECFDSCLQASQEIGYKEGIGASYANLGGIYSEQGKYEEAITSEFASKKIFEETGAEQNVANACEVIGETYLKQNKFDDALEYLNKGLDMSLKGGYLEIAKGAYKSLSGVYEALAKSGKAPSENWEKAHENYKNFVLFNDSLFNEATRKKSEQAQLQFEFDKKESAVKAEQDKKDALQAEEGRRQAIIRNCLLAGFLLVLALAFLIYRGYKMKQKANVTISRQKDMVEQKNLIIETKNKAITDSINYAHRIQRAMLVPEEEINKVLHEHFILYQPKDIVSGDFYFYKNHSATEKSGAYYLAACDCTGHGVPGAFMSLIGNEKLNDALDHAADTGTILKILNSNIKSSLHQTIDGESTRDGMDIALCSISPSGKGTGVNAQYSGANRPLWIIRKGENEIEEIKPNKFSIGGFTEIGTEFDSHTCELEKGDSVYLFTDGYADQFGGKEGKKLTTKKLKEILLSFSGSSMQEQKQKLANFIEQWKGGNEQVDDILVIGLRI